MKNSIHTVNYCGYTIHCENGLYWLAVFPFRKYYNLNAVKKEVDFITKDLNENIQNLKGLINRKN